MLLHLKSFTTTGFFVGGRSKILQRLCSTMSGDNPIVDVPGLGKLKGTLSQTAWTGKNIFQFQGVRYAEPAVGDKRFKAPVPVESFDGTFDATKFGRRAPAYSFLKRFTPEQMKENVEDCLNLCVYSTNLSAKKPVMVFIHGGGFYEGGASEHPPNYLLEKDVVLVVPQFRLGPLGFLSTKSETIPGNATMLDIKLALEWVQKNIASFGGDPENVTLFGNSAGAALVSAINYSPLIPETLFHKMILQSGSSLTIWSFDDFPEKNARDIAKIAGFSPEASSLEELNEFFMKVDLQTLYKAHNKHMFNGYSKGGNKVGGHRLTIGGPSDFMPVTPYNNMKKLKGRKNLPLLIGNCKHESTFSFHVHWSVIAASIGMDMKRINTYKLLDLINVVSGLNDHTGAISAMTIQTLFTPEQITRGNFKELLPGLIDLSGMQVFKSPVLKEAQANAFFNPKQTYLYSFNYRGEHTRFGFGADTSWLPYKGGVHHTDDLQYLFPYPPENTKLNEDDLKVAKRMVNLWTSFAETGVPTAEGVPTLKPMTNITGPYLRIEKECTIRENYHDEFDPILQDIKRKRKENPNYELYNEHGQLNVDDITK